MADNGDQARSDPARRAPCLIRDFNTGEMRLQTGEEIAAGGAAAIHKLQDAIEPLAAGHPVQLAGGTELPLADLAAETVASLYPIDQAKLAEYFGEAAALAAVGDVSQEQIVERLVTALDRVHHQVSKAYATTLIHFFTEEAEC